MYINTNQENIGSLPTNIPSAKSKVESLVSRINNQAVITFTYFTNGEISIECINSALYTTFDQRGIQIPANARDEFEGSVSIKIDHPLFPRAFFRFMYPSKRFSEKEYSHNIQFETKYR